MGSLTRERLYDLLPALYRIADAAEGEPLKALMALFAREFEALEDNAEQLYDDQFIETCAEWVTPYIGDLLGYRPLHGASPRISSPRAEVAHTIAFRRRKGTVAMLEELAHDVTGWPAHAVEFFEQLATTQHVKHVRLHTPAAADLRKLPALYRLDGAFNSTAHTAEMRRPEAGSGRYNIPNIGLFLWRLLPIRLSSVPLTPDAGDATKRKFRFNPLGADQSLFRRDCSDEDLSSRSVPANLPEPLGVRSMALAVRRAQASLPDDTSDDDYGPEESIALFEGSAKVPVPVSDIRICDLRDLLDSSGNIIGWNHEQTIPAGTIGVDPERGRILLGSPREALVATFHYAQARAIGGGEYTRAPEGHDLPAQETAAGGAPLQAGLDAVAAGGRMLIDDSFTYAQKPTFKATGRLVVVAAHDGVRPLVAATGDMKVSVGEGSRLVIDGLVFSGGALRVIAGGGDEARELVLRDCTLVPGRTLASDGSPASLGAVSLRVEDPFIKVTLERCIVGAIQAAADMDLILTDCILDACDPAGVAFEGLNAGDPGGQLTVTDSTIIGKVHTRAFTVASNSIFLARLGTGSTETWRSPVIAQRRQEGCMRFCFVPTQAITPRRFKCVPDATYPDLQPQFTSLRYGDCGYCQLRIATDRALREGADDGSEMGVLRPLMQPQREINLRIRLDEYLRFGLRAGIYYAT